MEGKCSESFRSMERLLREWLAGARLVEVVHLVQLAKTELTRRGITLTWSVNQAEVVEQTEGPCRAGEPRPGA